MHRIGAKTRLVPEIYLATRCLRLSRNGRKRLALPSLDRFWITLVGALQRLLRGQPEFGQQFAYSSHAKTHAKLALNETGHH